MLLCYLIAVIRFASACHCPEQDMVEIPYLDLLSMKMLTSGLQLVLPNFIVGFIKVGLDLMYSYMLLSVFITGISAIEKYNMKE